MKFMMMTNALMLPPYHTGLQWRARINKGLRLKCTDLLLSKIIDKLEFKSQVTGPKSFGVNSKFVPKNHILAHLFNFLSSEGFKK